MEPAKPRQRPAGPQKHTARRSPQMKHLSADVLRTRLSPEPQNRSSVFKPETTSVCLTSTSADCRCSRQHQVQNLQPPGGFLPQRPVHVLTPKVAFLFSRCSKNKEQLASREAPKRIAAGSLLCPTSVPLKSPRSCKRRRSENVLQLKRRGQEGWDRWDSSVPGSVLLTSPSRSRSAGGTTPGRC